MQFELTDETVNQIIFSMEDQSSRYVFDSEHNAITAVTGAEQANTDRFYPLPVWDSVNGFSIMERFVSELKNPHVKEKLRTVLCAGKGVFRAFKDVLKQHPEVEVLWFAFKQRALKHEISVWYNVLRESWGLEKIGEEPEETDELICSDFTFRPCICASDIAAVGEARAEAEAEILSFYGSWPGSAVLHIYRSFYKTSGYKDDCILAAYTADGDFAAFISAAFLSKTEKTALMTGFYVLRQWRGLGVGKSLLLHFSELLKTEKRRLIVPSIHIPVFFEQVMFRSGFKRIPAGFYADADTHNL